MSQSFSHAKRRSRYRDLSKCDATDRVIARRLRTLRRAKGLSQQDVAHYIGIHFAKLQKLERAALPLSPRHLHKLASVLDVEVDSLFSDVNVTDNPKRELSTHHIMPKLQAEDPLEFSFDSLDWDSNETFQLIFAYHAITNKKLRDAFRSLVLEAGHAKS